MAENTTFSYHSTVLFVEDVERSKEFYTQVMGEEIDLDLGRNIIFRSGVGIWEGGFARGVIFGDAGSESENNNFSSKRMLELYYETDDMDRSVEAIEAVGVEWVHRVVEQPWCQRTIRFLDPDGHMIEIGERMDVCARRLAGTGKTPEEIAAATTLPLEVVRQMLRG
ncbi:VOC family protein [Methanofollis fontis]|uniref:Glyoxalase n=1 Tax=Methanofollis fontis TaxID=2052832 RepID=A0A483CWB8_9EURY|nr:VOC family protein [Methanofollis fontis]TAJ45861.1 glyoxalase [Methanofollis fontis]